MPSADSIVSVVLDDSGKHDASERSGVADLTDIEPSSHPHARFSGDADADGNVAALLRAALDEVEVAVVVLDATGEIVVRNRAFDSWHNPPADGTLTSDWIASMRLFEADGVTPMDSFDGPIARAQRGEPVTNLEYAVVARQGDVRFRRSSARQVVGADGQVAGMVVALHDITAQRRAERSALDIALHDQLTGLPNRILFDDRLELAVERGRRTVKQPAVLLVDIDRLKVVNDGYGHLIGDRSLAVVAERLCKFVRPGDTVARFGGDEFSVLVEQVEHETVTALAERLRLKLSEPFKLDGTEIRLTASIGLALREEAQGAAALLRDAHTALYSAKGLGGDQVQVFTPPLREEASHRVAIERVLVDSLRSGRLVPVFQPIVSTITGRIEVVEALARLRATDGSLIQPITFIPVAEETGLIGELDAQMLELACAQLRLWQDQLGPQCPAVNVNCSPKLAARQDLFELVTSTVERHGVPPALVRLELTETALLSSSGSTLASLRALRDAGFLLGVDDFGTGYASLTYLRDLPISFVKIDRRFVNGMLDEPSDAAIVSAVVRLGHALGLSVIAEGVETVEQREALRDAGCELSQGYLFSRAVPSAEITEMLRRQALVTR